MRQIRGKDPVTVEIEVNALSAKPLGQVAPGNLADLFALEELPDLPAGLRVRLKGFRERMARAIADLPNGAPFLDLVADLAELPPTAVPHSLRSALAAEVQRPQRGERERAAVAAAQARWDEVEPEVFVFAPPKRIPTVPAAPPRESAPRRREERPARERAAAPSRPSRTLAAADPERVAWIRQAVVESLSRALDRGLLEAVLVAGVRHRARDRYPDLTVQEIVAVLRELESGGRARHSAGRWRLPARF